MTRSTEKLISAALRDGCREHCDALIDGLRRLNAENERLRGIVPEVLERLNDELCDENETLKRSVALLQRHHATAWNRGHMMGMKANEDTARRALDAVKQDAWGNTQLTEALLKAEAQRDALLEALKAAEPYLRHADVAYNVYVQARAALVEDALQKFTDVSQEIEAALADLSHCPQCGGPADNGHDRSIPPNPYFCTRCMAEPVHKCPNCVSLQDQNTELDRKLAELEAALRAQS